jgi:iron complex outermembrane receptor protein
MRFCLFLFLWSAGMVCRGQSDSALSFQLADTLTIEITAFGQYRPEAQALPSKHLLRGATLDRYNKTSFVQSLNTLPGVRMEERSPGSYRLNMRGSSLRSPFGVRNVKVYYNGLPLTDAGGNTYFNQLAFNNITSIEIAKGPAGSMYGAGTGGLVLLNSLNPRQLGFQGEISGGSYGLVNVLGSARWLSNNKMQAVAGSFTTQNGFRDHTQMQRINTSYSGEWVKKKNYILSGHVLATDLNYQTPGGLTQAEFDVNPRQARPKVGTQPSAEDAKAAIDQQNLMVSLVQDWKMSEKWSNQTGIYGAYAQVRNPAIRNYEERNEPGWGGRTVLKRETKKAAYTQQWISGAEAQWGDFST